MILPGKIINATYFFYFALLVLGLACSDKNSHNSELLIASPMLDAKKIHDLVVRGADINFPDESGNAPLYLAVQNANYEATLSLVNHGANLDQKNKSGCTPLFAAVAISPLAQKTSAMPFVTLLVQAGADIFVRDGQGKNLLHYSADPEITAWLIARGLNPRQKDVYGKTPLDYSAEKIFKLRDSITGMLKKT